MDLSGRWRARVGDDELRRELPDPDLDDDSWAAVEVPSHWRQSDEFSAEDGPVFYRRRFEATRPAVGRRAWLILDGVFSQADVFLDGAYLGDTEGYFFPHAFELTEPLAGRPEHLLAVEVNSPPQRDRTHKRSLTGAFQHSPHVATEWNPGGIWAPVRIVETGPVRMERLSAVCVEASAAQAVMRFRTVLDAVAPTKVRIRTRIGDTEHEAEHPLAKGSNRVEWRVTVERPSLWWPRALLGEPGRSGKPALTDVTVDVYDVGTGELSDTRRLRTGLRQVRSRNWIFECNGERLHLKGVRCAPVRLAIGSATPDELRREVALAVDLGFDLMRLHAHISRAELYDAADAAGMLIWQDLPMYRGYARSVRKQAVRHAREAVDLLGHRPSVIVWCGHDEPVGIGDDERQFSGKALARQELPSWTKVVLDLSVHRALTRADPSRPVIAHSGVLPGPTSGGTDTHLSFGWEHGDERDLAVYVGRFPRLSRFVTGLAAQSVPTGLDVPNVLGADLPGAPDLPGADTALLELHSPRPAGSTSEEWALETQRYQATVVRRQIEELRRIKYRPNGGFAVDHLGDPLDIEAVSTSMWDWRRRPKLVVEAARAALAPVIVTADRLPARLAPKATIGLDVHVVNDRRFSLNAAVASATLRWPDGTSELWRWQGDVAADSVTRVGMIRALVPTTVGTGEAVLELLLEHPDATANNQYEAHVGE